MKFQSISVNDKSTGRRHIFFISNEQNNLNKINGILVIYINEWNLF